MLAAVLNARPRREQIDQKNLDKETRCAAQQREAQRSLQGHQASGLEDRGAGRDQGLVAVERDVQVDAPQSVPQC